MRLQSALLCSDIRHEVGGTNIIIGQFSSVSGGIDDKFSFCVFFGITEYQGMAALKIIIKDPKNITIMKFNTNSLACMDKEQQYVAHFSIRDLSLSLYGKYSIQFYNNDENIGHLNFMYRVANPKENKLMLDGKEIEVPRINLGDNNELQEYAKLFIRRFKPLSNPFKSVRFHSQFNAADGIGSVSMLLVDQMLANGIKVQPIPLITCQPDIDYMKSIKSNNVPRDKADITILNALPPHMKHVGESKRLLLFSYWEADKINKSWVNIADTADAIFVPSKYVKEVYRDSGVTKPVLVYKQPISNTFQYKTKKKQEYYTVLFIGTCIPRKGIDLFCRACDEVFGDDDKVRFRIHTKPWSTALGDMRTWLLETYGKDLKYQITDHTLSVKEIWTMMTDADILVAPSRSEGLGLIPIQSIWSGTPVVIPNHSGFKEYSDTKGVVTIDTNRKVSGDGIYSGGRWYEPDFDELCSKLKFARDNREKLLDDVKEGSRILRQRYDANSVYMSLETMINNIYMK
jgi:glycosyltransferase involved in cell wall biosynthesis